MTVYPSDFLCGECGNNIDVAPANLIDRETGKLKKPVIGSCINEFCSEYQNIFEVEPIELRRVVMDDPRKV